MSVKKLTPLKAGDLVSLAAPASAVKQKDIDRGVELLEAGGYKVRVVENATDNEDDPVLNKFAGADAERAHSFNRELADPDVKAILCLTGGYGASRVTSQLDYASLAQHPKIITGFSDITAVHMAVYRETGLPSLHSPNVDSLPKPDITVQSWLSALKGDLAGIPSQMSNQFTKDSPVEIWQEGEAEGRLLGGNLTLVSALEGTPHDLPKNEDMILFIEEVGEFAYRVDLTLQQMKMCGTFDRVKGVLLGQFTKRDAQEKEAPGLLEDVLRTFFKQYNIPVIANIPAGHVKLNMTLALGAMVKISTNQASLSYTEPVFTIS